jgi:hypothetical protein
VQISTRKVSSLVVIYLTNNQCLGYESSYCSAHCEDKTASL